MIIYKNTSNTVVLTLAEKQTSATHDWLFELSNDMGNPTKYFSSVDISNFPDRYNKFTITEGIDVTLELSGSWSYKVYEMPVMSPPSLDKTLALAICETGQCLVIDTIENQVINFDEDELKQTNTFDEP